MNDSFTMWDLILYSYIIRRLFLTKVVLHNIYGYCCLTRNT